MSRGVRRNALVKASERLPKEITPGCEGLRIKNLLRQAYGFVIQFCQLTELVSVEKEHNSIELVNTHTISRHHPLVAIASWSLVNILGVIKVPVTETRLV